MLLSLWLARRVWGPYCYLPERESIGKGSAILPDNVYHAARLWRCRNGLQLSTNLIVAIACVRRWAVRSNMRSCRGSRAGHRVWGRPYQLASSRGEVVGEDVVVQSHSTLLWHHCCHWVLHTVRCPVLGCDGMHH